MISYPDNIELGLAKLPLGLAGDDQTNAYLSVYLQRYNAIQQPLADVLNWLLTWDLENAQVPSWILDLVGNLLGCPRPSNMGDLAYRRVLLVQRIARKSSGTQPDVRRVVARLGEYADGSFTAFLIPHTVSVTLGNFSKMQEQGFTLDVVVRILENTIADGDRLLLWDAVGNPFTWDTEGQGWNQGLWAVSLYDSND